MKKRILIYGGTILLGIIFAFFFYNNIEESYATVTENNPVTVFQLGVYQNENNAINACNKIKPCLVYQDNNYYRLIGAITVNKELEIGNYFKTNNIDFFKRTIKLPNKYYDLIKLYEKDIIDETTLIEKESILLKAFKQFYE